MYVVKNKSNNFEIMKSGFKTKKKAKLFIKELKEFDKRNNCPFDDKFIIEKEEK